MAEAPPGQSVLAKIARATFVILFVQVLWKLAGFILNVLVAYYYGPSAQADAYYFVSENVIFLLQTLSYKLAIPVIVPLFIEQRTELGEERAWEFLNTVINLVLILQALVMVAGMVYAPEFIALAGGGFNRETEELAERMMRWCMPGVFVLSFTTVTYAILNSYKEVGYMTWGEASQKIFWMLAFLALGIMGHRDLQAVVIGFFVGTAANLAIHLIGLRRCLRYYRPGFPLLSRRRLLAEIALVFLFSAILVALGVLLARAKTPSAALQATCASVAIAYLLLLAWRAKRAGSSIARFAALSVPLLIGILFAKYRDLFTNFFATFTGEGVFSDLKFARKVGELPNTLIAQAIGLAMLPYLSELAQKKEWDEFAHVMTRTLKVMFLVFVPLTVATVILRYSLIGLLYDRGDWEAWHLRHAGDALGLYILGLLFFAIENPLQQSFFSMQRNWTPTLVGILSTAFHLLFLYLGIQVFGFNIFFLVALVYPIARIFKGVLLLATMRAIIPILPFRETSLFLAKMALACLGLAGGLAWSHRELTRRLDLAPYRAREIMVDTFNVEAPRWTSENIVELEPVVRPGEGSNHCLWAHYVRSPRRRAALRRSMDEFAAAAGSRLSLEFRCDSSARLSAQVATEDDQLSAATVIDVSAGQDWQALEYSIPPPPPGKRWSTFLIRDETPTPRMIPAQLWLDNLSLNGQILEDFDPSARGWRIEQDGGILQVVDIHHEEGVRALLHWGLPPEEAEDLARRFPSRTRQQLQVVDWLNRRKHQALTGSPASSYLREAIREDRKPPEGFGKLPHAPVEYALLPAGPDGSPLVFSRSLASFLLEDLSHLSFKAKSEQPTTLRISLLTPDGDATVEVPIKKSEERKSYKVMLRDFKAQSGSLALARVTAVRFEEPGGRPSGRLWLDNLAFSRPTDRVRFETIKLMHCVLPCLAGLVIFCLLLRLLRVEEAGEVARWLQERGLAKLRRRRHP